MSTTTEARPLPALSRADTMSAMDLLFAAANALGQAQSGAYHAEKYGATETEVDEINQTVASAMVKVEQALALMDPEPVISGPRAITAAELESGNTFQLPFRMPQVIDRSSSIPAGTEVEVFDTYPNGPGQTCVRFLAPGTDVVRSVTVMDDRVMAVASDD